MLFFSNKSISKSNLNVFLANLLLIGTSAIMSPNSLVNDPAVLLSNNLNIKSTLLPRTAKSNPPSIILLLEPTVKLPASFCIVKPKPNPPLVLMVLK